MHPVRDAMCIRRRVRQQAMVYMGILDFWHAQTDVGTILSPCGPTFDRPTYDNALQSSQRIFFFQHSK